MLLAVPLPLLILPFALLVLLFPLLLLYALLVAGILPLVPQHTAVIVARVGSCIGLVGIIRLRAEGRILTQLMHRELALRRQHRR